MVVGGRGEGRLGFRLEVGRGMAEVVVGFDGEAVGGAAGGLSASGPVDAGGVFSMGLRFSGVLKGETKGLESVAEAVSRRRRLVAGVEVMFRWVGEVLGWSVLWC